MSIVQRNHLMPFGTKILDDGRISFRLWAPGAKKVELCLQGLAPEVRFMMAAEDDGWFGIISQFAYKGFYYQYRIDDELYIPDPASRYQPEDVNGSSQVIDPHAFQWSDDQWKGLPWESAVFYEIHVGTFSEEGSFNGVKNKLDYLVDLGVTAIQLMPIAEFSGQRNWGYDGVLPFAPDSSYGTPDELKDLIASAHAKGLMVFNDVVYSHFGPEGNYLAHYAPDFFTSDLQTPWGNAINFEGKNSHCVRQFFIHNALFWLEEYHFDGLRLDAVHAIFDSYEPGFLQCLAEAVRKDLAYDRQIHLVLENDHNTAHYLSPSPEHPYNFYTAQWNDDFHHALHILLTGENSGYYQDYSQHPIQYLGRCLSEGFAYQGEVSAYRNGKLRGEMSTDLPPTAFVNFLQNHDQVGNRAFGERLANLCPAEALRAATAILLLSPSTPLLFMGQEWACSQPFTYFVDFPDPLGEQIAQGRFQEFSRFTEYNDPEILNKIQLPNATDTFMSAKLDWDEINILPHLQWLKYHQELLRIRRLRLQPLLKDIKGGKSSYWVIKHQALIVHWQINDNSILKLLANLGDQSVEIETDHSGELLFSSTPDAMESIKQGKLNRWTVVYLFENNHAVPAI
ncbi:malto-oligosyltrehalose trehalohydrolase [Methyloprofundus sedimenti]|uniref:Malto-oligosyltrehalose trehalohydrolase n=1 Tax=Methyloprofundus sedimenti TaxID=1420851 RepID=A0A1V8MAW1_9GAMM|nr:malto-oligosyltrehalose trehalohydrolase [Methyloprofundus sedimenti]OQK18666.1 malto-oligosyltrehalose trehalohydrolase [Methyloprofundus sedimenti]